VQARGGDVWYRTRRHVRRYWIPLAAAVMVTASLTAGLMIANRQRAIAERRFADVRQLAGKLFDIDMQVAQLPGGSKTRQLIVDTALEYLQRVTADVHMQPDLALELGAAYMRVGRVQGVNISPNLGQTEKADLAEQKAQALIDSVLAVQPGSRPALLRAAQIAHDRMILAADGHHNDDALRFAQTCLERIDRYLKTGTLNASSDRLEAQQVIIALINVANRYMNADRFDDSLQVSARAIEIARQTNWPTQAAAALMVVALAHRGKGELDEALSAARESARGLQPDNGEKSTGRWQTYGLALIRQGQILGEDKAISLNRPEEAVACFERARRIGEDFAQRDSGDFQSQYRVFLAESKSAAIVRHASPARALALYDDGLRRLSGVRQNSGTLRNEVTTLAASTDPLLRLGRRDEARNRLESAFRLLRRSDHYPAAQIELGSPADITLRAQAEYEVSGGNVTRGAAVYEELLRLVAASNPKPETRLQDAMELSNIYQAAASVYRRAGRMDIAGFHARRRLDLWTGWNRRLPNSTFVLRELEEARRDSLPEQTRLPGRRPTSA
jgi:tetratricopeptide (TPR) repeat protein